MAIDGQVCLAPMNPQGCTTGLVEPLKGFNKAACGAKLLPTTVLAYPVDQLCLFLSFIEDTSLLPVSYC